MSRYPCRPGSREPPGQARRICVRAKCECEIGVVRVLTVQEGGPAGPRQSRAVGVVHRPVEQLQGSALVRIWPESLDERVSRLYYWINTRSQALARDHRPYSGIDDVQIHISPSDGVPIYLQIVNQVKHLVSSGRLVRGEELPPIRVLAERLLVNPNTVARAYRELETLGVVEKHRTAGTYVSEAGSPLARRERVKILTERVDALVAEARQLGIELDDVVALLRRRDQAMPSMGGERS